MPFTHTWEARGLVRRLYGVLTPDEMLHAFSTMATDARFENILYIINDARDADLSRLSLTFTLATGAGDMAGSAIETMEGIRSIKAALPGVLTSLGVSNVSFGLNAAARAAINSVFLHHCVQAGLDLAMVHPKDITPYPEIDPQVRELCDDLILNRSADALPRLIAHFENVKSDTSKAVEDPTQGFSLEQKIHWMIVHRKKEGIEPLIEAAIAAHGYAIGLPAADAPDSYCAITHGTGHGIGLDVHEPPLLDKGGPELVAGVLKQVASAATGDNAVIVVQ